MKKENFFDGLALVDGHFSGVGQYVLGILRGLGSELEKEEIAGHITSDAKVIVPRDMKNHYYGFGFKYINPVKFPVKFRSIFNTTTRRQSGS